MGSDARAVFDTLLRAGVIVRPLNAFGSETAIRVTVGTPGFETGYEGSAGGGGGGEVNVGGVAADEPMHSRPSSRCRTSIVIFMPST